jgi:hypothetical protein
MKKIKVQVEDFGRAIDLSARFNLSSGARPGVRVKAVLGQAVDFMAVLLPELAQNRTINAGSHHGTDPFLNLELGRSLARQKDATAYLTGTTLVSVSDKSVDTLRHIRKAFHLSSDTQAAALSIRLYRSALDHFWRGNGLTLVDEVGHEAAFDVPSLKERALTPVR